MASSRVARCRARIAVFLGTVTVAGCVALWAAPHAVAAGGTTVGGILSEDTVWTPEEGPYRITSAVQVPAGVTLTIRPGTHVVAAGAAELFLLHGTLLAEGTESDRIDFDGAGTANFFSGRSASAAVLRLQHTNVHDGRSLWPATGYASHARWHISDSTFRNLSGYSYLWYPTADSAFERNVFTNSGGFSVGTDSKAQVTFTQNRFAGPSRSGYWIRNWAAYGRPTLVTGNTFMPAGSPAVELQDGYDSAKLEASGNYWSTTDTTVIDTMIADSRDSITRAGLIPYEPFLTQASSQTPPVDSGDRDGDTIGDGSDNCWLVENADQSNTDGDRFGDACDDVVDVANGSVTYSFVKALINAKITAGCGGTSVNVRFCPDAPVSRGDMSIFLARAAEGRAAADALPAYTGGFNDVSVGDYYSRYVRYLADNTVTGGCGSDNYCPTVPVRRGDMTIFLSRSKLGRSTADSLPAYTGGFSDVTSGDYYSTGVRWAKDNSITAGCGDGSTFCPGAAVTRGQMAIFLTRTFGLTGT